MASDNQWTRSGNVDTTLGKNALIIVGHGPSSRDCGLGDFIDGHTVCRLRRAETNEDVGFKTDIVCSSQERYRQKDKEFWWLKGSLLNLCVDKLRVYKPKNPKPSTGLSACIIGSQRWDKIGLIGFDYTLHPERTKHWRHDSYAENRCLLALDVEITDLE